MSWQWNGKRDALGLILILFFPAVAGMTMAILFPVIFRFPILSCVLVGIMFVIGFRIVWKRTGNSKK